MGSYFDQEFGIVLDEDTILLHLLRADDLILMASSLAGLQEQMDGLQKLCALNLLIVSQVKTNFMVFGRGSIICP